MQIKFLANVTLKYWHFHINIVMFSNMIPFIVVIIAQVTIENVTSSDPICVCATVPDCCLHSCTCNTLILAVYEFVCVPIAVSDIFL